MEELLGTNETTAATAAALGVGILFLLGKARLSNRGTTLVAPWTWAAFSTSAVAGTELAAGLAGLGAGWILPLRTIAAMSTFCPLMAVLGAKRPQDRAWQFVVLALWAVLCLPAAEGWLFGAGEPQETHPARAWFLLVLVGVTAVNYLPTRYWFSSLLFSAAQIAVLSAYLPFGGRGFPGAAGPLLGLALSLAAAAAAVFGPAAARRARDPLDRAWLDFRDRFGTLWALRVAERINASARMYGWPTHLRWTGFVHGDAAPGDNHPRLQGKLEPAIALGLRNLLRRFVSDAWLTERLGREPSAERSVEAGVASRPRI
jgi:hypothetical protein